MYWITDEERLERSKAAAAAAAAGRRGFTKNDDHEIQSVFLGVYSFFIVVSYLFSVFLFS